VKKLYILMEIKNNVVGLNKVNYYSNIVRELQITYKVLHNNRER